MNSTNKVWFGFTYRCVPKFLLIAIFAIIIYIHQYDKHVNREFSFKNVGFFIAANVWGMAIHKLTSNVIHVYISNATGVVRQKRHLNGPEPNCTLKLNSCHVVRWYIFLIKYICTCFSMIALVTASIIWRKSMIPGNFWTFEHKGGDKANKIS